MQIFRAVFLAVLIIAAVSFFAARFARLVKLIAQGQPDDRTGDWAKRIRNVVEQVFLHKRLMDRPGIGLAHLLIFYGFITVQLCAFEIFGKGFYPKFDYSFLGPLYPLLMLAQDVMCLAVMIGLAYAAYRRVAAPPQHLMLTKDAWIIITLTYGVVVTIYALGAIEIALGEREPVRAFMPFENALSGLVAGASHDSLHIWKEILLWGHIFIVLGFLTYLPRSKHLHLLGAIPNIFFSRTERLAALPTPDLEKEDIEVFGASEPKHFSWKHLLDTAACTECGRCTSNCPAAFTGKPLSPMKIIHDLKLALFDSAPALFAEPALAGAGANGHGHNGHDHGGHGAPETAAAATATAEQLPLIGGRTTHDELWSCTTCGACVAACPVMIEHVDDIVDMRRNLVLMQSEFPEELQRTFTALENEGNPWGVSAGDRGNWAVEAGVKILDDQESTPLLYWVGCAGACDSRAKKVTAAIVKILRHAGIDFAVLGHAETCTGDPARRVGNEYLYQTLAKQNIETLNAHNIRKVLTQCPHCYNAIGKEYPDLDGFYEVVHHTEFIEKLLAEGKLKLKPGAADSITFHDPCYLGRWNGVVEAPRTAIRATAA